MPPAGAPYEAVTFDYWNTLVREDDSAFEHRRRAVAEVLGSFVDDLDPKRVAAAFEHGWRAYRQAWMDGRMFAAADAVPLMLEFLGAGSAPPQVAAEVLAVIVDPPGGTRPPLTPNLASTLAALREAGIRIGIVCDVGLTPSAVLRRWLADHGVLDHFDHWSFSDEVGAFKPAPAIFHHALAGLGAAAARRIDPCRAVHVGDLRRTDVAGAKALGMTAVRYTGVADDPVSGSVGGDSDAEGDYVVADHSQLLEVLGLT